MFILTLLRSREDDTTMNVEPINGTSKDKSLADDSPIHGTWMQVKPRKNLEKGWSSSNNREGSAFVESITGWSDHTIIPSELDATERVTSGSRSIYIFMSQSGLAIFYELGYFSTRMELIFWHVLILGKLSQYSFWEAEGLQCHSIRARRSRTVT